MYVQGYLQGSENGRVVTIVQFDCSNGTNVEKKGLSSSKIKSSICFKQIILFYNKIICLKHIEDSVLKPITVRGCDYMK